MIYNGCPVKLVRGALSGGYTDMGEIRYNPCDRCGTHPSKMIKTVSGDVVQLCQSCIDQAKTSGAGGKSQ